jgi:hypothetical protein
MSKTTSPRRRLSRIYKYVLATALIVGCTLPAFAEKGFYIVRGPDKKCTVVETAPSATDTTVTRVGKNVYVTREEADQDMAVVCK